MHWLFFTPSLSWNLYYSFTSFKIVLLIRKYLALCVTHNNSINEIIFSVCGLSSQKHPCVAHSCLLAKRICHLIVWHRQYHYPLITCKLLIDFVSRDRSFVGHGCMCSWTLSTCQPMNCTWSFEQVMFQSRERGRKWWNIDFYANMDSLSGIAWSRNVNNLFHLTTSRLINLRRYLQNLSFLFSAYICLP